MNIISQDQSLLKNFMNLTGEVYGYLRIRFFIILIAQFFIGLLENLGILTLLPVIYVALDLGGTENNHLYQYLEMFFQRLHIPMELEYLLFIFAALIVMKSFLNFLASYLVQVEILKIVADLRRQLIAAFFQARWSFFTRIEPGKYGSILTGELVKTSSAVTAVFLLLNGLVISAIYLASALVVSFKLTLLVFIVSLASMAFLNPLIAHARQAGYKNSRVLNNITTLMINTLQGMKSIKAMGIEDRSRKILLNDNRAALDSSRKTYFFTILFKNVRDPVVAVALIATIFLSLYVLDLPLPNLAVLLLIFNRSLVKMMDMQSVVQSFAVNEAGYLNVRHAIEEIREYTEDSKETPQAAKKQLRFEKGIAVHNLTTLIEGAPILEHVSFTLPARGLHVFTGPSGGGKTSLIDTLITLRDEYEGSVLYDDIDLQQIDPAAIRQNTGYVMQEIQLFHTTIRENILIARPEATDEQIFDILKNVNAAEFVSQLENGLDTVVGEAGSKLSGGQRQRIALARALIRRPKILILDEVTSALDRHNAEAIMSTIRDIAAHTCIILISHDQSAIQWADQVFEVKDKTVKKIK